MVITKIIVFDDERILDRRRISEIRFREVGAAILADDARNQRMVEEGKRASIPLVRNRLRVCVVSYIMLARANRAGEERPWAIIIKSLLSQPHEHIVIVPDVKSPMCPIDE